MLRVSKLFDKRGGGGDDDQTKNTEVLRREDIESHVEERLPERAPGEIANITQDTGDGVDRLFNKLNDNDGSDDATTKKQTRIIRLVACFTGIVLVAFILVLILFVVVTHKKCCTPNPNKYIPPDENNSTLPPSQNETLPPTTAQPVPFNATRPPTTAKPVPINATLPPKPNNNNRSCEDFPCTSRLTILELVNNASNHTILAKYLNRNSNLNLTKYLLSENNNVTLFAPTDQSFEALRLPFSWYLSENRYWQWHLWFLLATHILSTAENGFQIFQNTNKYHQTILSNVSLSVDINSTTIENNASIVVQDIQASNGYIQVPDRVLINHNLRYSLFDTVGPDFVFSNSTTKFRKLIQAVGLESLLQKNFENGLTLFLPTDDAFDLLDANVTAALFDRGSNDNNTALIKELVLYHMLSTNLVDLQVGSEYSLVMLNNVSAWFTNSDNQTFVNTAALVQLYLAQNGVLHIIDKVLVPPNIGEFLQITTNVTTLFNLATFTGIVKHQARLGTLFNGDVDGRNDLGNYYESSDYLTVFAPVASAFTELNPKLLIRLLKPSWLLHLQSLCLHHFTVDTHPERKGQYELAMLSGFNSTLDVLVAGSALEYGKYTIDDAAIEKIPGSARSLLGATKGVIQFIDKVLLPPWVNQSIHDKLSENQEIWEFVSFLQLTGFGALFKTKDGPYTVFAPNNAAILQAGFPQGDISQFVSRHVVLGNIYITTTSSSTPGTRTVVSLANETLTLRTKGNKTYIGDALIVQSNNLASNGVIHVIDHDL